MKDRHRDGYWGRRTFLRYGVIVTSMAAAGCVTSLRAEESYAKPNIIVILADDLGFGSVGCYGATKVKTPNIDRIAREGMRFTDAHSPAAVCVPSRYGLLTGRYLWRIPDAFSQKGLRIREDEATIASILKEEGYSTACIGKWHLGFGTGPTDWNGALKPGPLEVGFDYYFGTPVSHNESPQVLVENHHVLNLDPSDPIRFLPNGGFLGRVEGGEAARFNPKELGTRHAEKAVEFIEKNKEQPFFLYLATNNVHGPHTPAPRFQGTSEIGVYGDYIHELDWMTGEVLAKLDGLNLSDNTLVIFTSDNGAMLTADTREAGFLANGALIGQKTDSWEGGHRVPFVARWPRHIAPRSRSDKLICINDLFATTSALMERELEAGEGPDSCNILPALLGQPTERPLRENLVLSGTHEVAIREGKWLLIKRPGSGGFTTELEMGQWMTMGQLKYENSDYTDDGKPKPGAPPGQLYDLEKDPHQTTNVYSEHPEIVERLSALLREIEGEDDAEEYTRAHGRVLNAVLAPTKQK
jgi:arylsulfatase A